jgi:hypothetical protein
MATTKNENRAETKRVVAISTKKPDRYGECTPERRLSCELLNVCGAGMGQREVGLASHTLYRDNIIGDFGEGSGEALFAKRASPTGLSLKCGGTHVTGSHVASADIVQGRVHFGTDFNL